MKKKIKIHIMDIDHWFESKQDAELYKRICFPHLIQQAPPPQSSEPTTLWIDEAITYLGLDRIGLKRPDKAIHRLVKKRALHPTKISGRLCFDRAENSTGCLPMGITRRGEGDRGRGSTCLMVLFDGG